MNQLSNDNRLHPVRHGLAQPMAQAVVGLRLARSLQVRAEADTSSETRSRKRRSAIKARIPNVLVVAEREASAKTVTSRRHGKEKQRTTPFFEFREDLLERIRTRSADILEDRK